MKARLELMAARLFACLPLSWARAIGGFFGAREGRRGLAAQRKWAARIDDNLRRLKGIESASERRRGIVEFTRRIGRIYAEIIQLHRLDASGKVSVQGRENLAAIDRPVILVSAHLSNWELIGHLLKHELNERPWCVLYLPLETEVKTRLACEARAGWNPDLRLLPTSSPFSLREINRAIARGMNLLIFVDEEKHGYVWAPSLGRTPTYKGNLWFAARLAVRHGLDILPAYVEPTEAEGYRVVVEPLLRVAGTGEAESLRLAQQMDQSLDRWVRQWPEHWYWLPLLELDKKPPEYTR